MRTNFAAFANTQLSQFNMSPITAEKILGWEQGDWSVALSAGDITGSDLAKLTAVVVKRASHQNMPKTDSANVGVSKVSGLKASTTSKAIVEYASPDELLNLRKKLNLSQKQCEKLIGKNRHWWEGHEKGIVKTRREYLDRLQTAFDALSDDEKAKICKVTIPDDVPLATPAEMLTLRKELGIQAANCSSLLGKNSAWWRQREISCTKTPKHFLDDLRSAFEALPQEEKARLQQWNNTLDGVATQEEVIALRKELGLLREHCDQLLGKGRCWWRNHETVVKETPRHILDDLRQVYSKLPESTKKQFFASYLLRYAKERGPNLMTLLKEAA